MNPPLTSDSVGPQPNRFGELLQFLRPFMVPQRKSIIGALILGGIGVIAAALVPLVVESALSDVSASDLALLFALMAVSLTLLWQGQRLSYRVSAEVARDLTSYVYRATIGSPVLRQEGLRRPSVVSRHTSDVDRIEEAVDQSLTDGLPSMLRIAISLGLLCYVEPFAGLILLAAVLVFLVLYRHIGSGLLDIDRTRLDASSDVGALVDESITASRSITGMNLASWMSERLSARTEVLRRSTLLQKRQIRRLVNAARVVGYLALFAVVLRGLLGGSSTAGAVAAALLYINDVVRGLEALPPWLRSLRLATTSKRRIERITLSTPRVAAPDDCDERPGEGLVLRNLMLSPFARPTPEAVRVPSQGLIALVADAGQSSSRLLEVMGGDANPDGGAVTLDGGDVRHPLVKRRIIVVANETHLMDTSVRDHLRAVDANVDADRIVDTLRLVALEHLVELPDGGLDARLGVHAAKLAVHERQRLLLAMAALSTADVVMIESLPVLTDVDEALPLLTGISGFRRRPVIVATRNSEVAQACDSVIAVLDDTVVVGRHSDLLARDDYASMWERQAGLATDARVLAALPESQREALKGRLVTEQFSAGDTLFRSGSPADRMMYVITGRVAVFTEDDTGVARRVADVGPGNFCGQLDAAGSRHTTTVRAVNDTLVRTVSVEAWSAGLLGLIDAEPTERTTLKTVLRAGAITRADVLAATADHERDAVGTALDRLVERGILRVDSESRYHLVQQRRLASGTVLDRLLDV